MALLSQLIRTAAITGRTDTVNAWFAGRQGGRWAEQMVADAFPNLPNDRRPGATPPPAPPRDPAKNLRELEELHQRGVLTDAEFEVLRDQPA